MSIGSLLLGIALLAMVVLFLARPFLANRRPDKLAETTRQKLLASKESLLDQIQALDFDHETGKMPTDLYEPERARLIGETSQLLRRLDGLENVQSDLGAARPATSIEEEIEAAIARVRQVRTAAPINGRKQFCTQCGKPVDLGDRFCAHCGHALSVVPTTSSGRR